MTTITESPVSQPLSDSKDKIRRILQTAIDSQEAFLTVNAKFEAAGQAQRQALADLELATDLRDLTVSRACEVKQVRNRQAEFFAEKIRACDAARSDLWRSGLSDDQNVFVKAVKFYAQAVREVQHAERCYTDSAQELRNARKKVSEAESVWWAAFAQRELAESALRDISKEWTVKQDKTVVPNDELFAAERELVLAACASEDVTDVESGFPGWQCQTPQDLGLLRDK